MTLYLRPPISIFLRAKIAGDELHTLPQLYIDDDALNFMNMIYYNGMMLNDE